MAANQSRRTFVKTAGTTLMVAGLAGMGLVGCSSQGASSGTGSTGDASSDGFEWDEETDVLVVGSGLAGVAAAVTVAKEDPNATCLLIEKGQSISRSFGRMRKPGRPMMCSRHSRAR